MHAGTIGGERGSDIAKHINFVSTIIYRFGIAISVGIIPLNGVVVDQAAAWDLCSQEFCRTTSTDLNCYLLPFLTIGILIRYIYILVRCDIVWSMVAVGWSRVCGYGIILP